MENPSVWTKGVAVPIPIRLRCWWRSQKIDSRFQPRRRTRENRLTPLIQTPLTTATRNQERKQNMAEVAVAAAAGREK